MPMKATHAPVDRWSNIYTHTASTNCTQWFKGGVGVDIDWEHEVEKGT